MYLEDALRAIGEEKTLDAFPLFMRQRPFETGSEDFDLCPESVMENARMCGIRAESVRKIGEAFRMVGKSPAAGLAVQCVFRTVYLEKQYAFSGDFPEFHAFAGRLGGSVLLGIASGFVPLIKRWHEKAHIPARITENTLAILSHVSENGEFFTGDPGITQSQLKWMRNYLSEELFYLQIGRFGFMAKSNYLPFALYREKSSGTEFCFANAGLPVASDGFGADASDCVFRTVFEIRDGILHANRIRPDGSVEREVSSLRLENAELVLGAGTPVLDMHIPAGGGMSPEIADESFREARAFYEKILPAERRPKAVICCSWIFNPSLPQILPPEANLNRLLAKVHSVPVASGPEAGLAFVFRPLPGKKFDPSVADRRTSLQRAVLSWIEGGHRWRVGGMYLPLNGGIFEKKSEPGQ